MRVVCSFLVISLFLILAGCRNTKATSTTGTVDAVSDGYDFEIYMRKNPCFGQCPTYELTIDADGMVIYNGEMYVEKEGAYRKQLVASEFDELKQMVLSIGFFELEDKYDNEMIMDLPSTVISLTNEKKHKSVESKYGAPESLKTLERKLNEIALSDYGWTKVKSADKEWKK